MIKLCKYVTISNMIGDEFQQRYEKSMRNELLNEIRSVLESGREININIEQSLPGDKPRLGDSIIRISSVISILQNFAELAGFPKPKFVYSYVNSNGEGEPYPLSQAVTLVKMFLNPDAVSVSVIDQIVAGLSELLGVKNPDSLLPLQKIEGHPWFNDFNREKVENEKELIKTTPQTIVIMQTGSESYKRWNSQQLSRLAERARSLPNSKVFILSDAKIRGDKVEQQELDQLFSNVSVEVIYFSTIEEVAAYSGIADYFFSTDSAPAWIWGSEKKSGSVALIQHTVASEFWKVPGANITMSKALLLAKQSGQVARNGMIGNVRDTTEERRILYNKLSGISSDNIDITTQDFEKYLEDVGEILDKSTYAN